MLVLLPTEIFPRITSPPLISAFWSGSLAFASCEFVSRARTLYLFTTAFHIRSSIAASSKTKYTYLVS